jgi:hypothetical protein
MPKLTAVCCDSEQFCPVDEVRQVGDLIILIDEGHETTFHIIGEKKSVARFQKMLDDACEEADSTHVNMLEDVCKAYTKHS